MIVGVILLARWRGLLLLRRITHDDLEASCWSDDANALANVETKYSALLDAIADVIEKTERTRPRSNWDRPWSDGIIVGLRNDERDLQTVAAGRKVAVGRRGN
jgi:hypothetical protein